jgi:hypothetical protein
MAIVNHSQSNASPFLQGCEDFTHALNRYPVRGNLTYVGTDERSVEARFARIV